MQNLIIFKQNKPSLESFIQQQIKKISIFDVLTTNKDIENEIKIVTISIINKIEELLSKKDSNNNSESNQMNSEPNKMISVEEKINTVEKYNMLLENIKKCENDKQKYSKYLNYIKEIKESGFGTDNLDILISFANMANDTQLEIYHNKHNQLLSEGDNFSICILFDNKLNIWLNQRIDPNKDFYLYYQVGGGKVEQKELFEDCVIREMGEEAGIKILKKDLNLICFDNYFSGFKNKIFKCAIFAYHTEQTPINKEPTKQGNWFKTDIDTILTKYQLTDSLERQFDKIKQYLSDYKKNNIKSKRVQLREILPKPETDSKTTQQSPIQSSQDPIPPIELEKKKKKRKRATKLKTGNNKKSKLDKNENNINLLEFKIYEQKEGDQSTPSPPTLIDYINAQTNPDDFINDNHGYLF